MKNLFLFLLLLPLGLFAQENKSGSMSRSSLAGILSSVSLDNLKKTHDDISGITWYTQKYFTHYSNTNRVSMSIAKPKNDKHWLALEVSYADKDWLFFKKAYLSYDGNTKEIVFNEYANKETDIEEGGVFEWIALEVDNSYIDFIENFAKSPNAKVRLVGKYTKDRVLSADERKGLVDVALAYKAIKK